jgi:endoglucanase
LPITLSMSPSDVQAFSNYDYASVTNFKTATSITPGNPTTIIFTTPHGWTTGQKVICRGFSGTTLDFNVNSDRTFYAATVINSTTITVPIDTTGQTWAKGNFTTGYDGIVFAGYHTNSAGTYIHKLDYSAANLIPGEYRLRIPGLGVSDPFVIDENVHMQAITTYAKGYYNQSSGFGLNGWGNWTRPVDYKDGVNGCQIFESLAPSVLVDETGWGAGNDVVVRAEDTAVAPWVTATRATGFGGSIRDAGDWDYHVSRHCQMAYQLLEFGYRGLPTSAKGLKFGFPLASSFLGSTYSGIDALDDSIHMALMQLDCWRATQKGDGRVYSGIQFGTGPFWITGGGGSTVEPSFISNQQGVTLSADPVSNFIYAVSAAKMAQVFNEAGFTTLGTMWKDSAVAAWGWANTLYVDYIANGATGSAVQAYFNTTLGVQSKKGWTAAQFASWVSFAFNAPNYRLASAAILYELTGNTLYSNVFVTPFTNNAIGDGDQDGSMAVYEILNSARITTDFPNPTISTASRSYYESRLVAGCMHLQTAFGLEGTGGLPYQGYASPGAVDLYVLRALSYSRPTDMTLPYVKYLHAQMTHQHGANQTGKVPVTRGIGVRAVGNCSLIRDRQAMGIKGKDIDGTAIYFVNGDSGWNFLFNNFLYDDAPSNFTSEVRTGLYDASTGANKIINPHNHLSVPKQETYADASMIIYNSEFVTQNTIVPSYVAARWQQAFGNNTQTTPSVRRIRRSLAITSTSTPSLALNSPQNSQYIIAIL